MLLSVLSRPNDKVSSALIRNQHIKETESGTCLLPEGVPFRISFQPSHEPSVSNNEYCRLLFFHNPYTFHSDKGESLLAGRARPALWIPLDAPHLESKESILKISIHATHREREFKSGNLLTDRNQVTRTELSCKEWYLSVILVGTSVGARYGRFSITDTLSTVVKKRD